MAGISNFFRKSNLSTAHLRAASVDLGLKDSIKTSSETRFYTSHIEARAIQGCMPGIRQCIDKKLVKFTSKAVCVHDLCANSFWQHFRPKNSCHMFPTHLNITSSCRTSPHLSRLPLPPHMLFSRSRVNMSPVLTFSMLGFAWHTRLSSSSQPTATFKNTALKWSNSTTYGSNRWCLSHPTIFSCSLTSFIPVSWIFSLIILRLISLRIPSIWRTSTGHARHSRPCTR